MSTKPMPAATGAWAPASATRTGATMDMVSRVSDGLPLDAVETLSAEICPQDRAFKYRFVSKATYNRRRSRTGDRARLSKDEGERLVRMARIWRFAAEVWGGRDNARDFMFAPHMLLDGKTPAEVTLSSELGGRMVEEVLGRLAYGSAA